MSVIWQTDSDKFTCLWNTHGRNTRSRVILNKIEILTDEKIPFLDVLIVYDRNGDADFKVGVKEGTKIKYVNGTRNHSKLVLKEVLNGVL